MQWIAILILSSLNRYTLYLYENMLLIGCLVGKKSFVNLKFVLILLLNLVNSSSFYFQLVHRILLLATKHKLAVIKTIQVWTQIHKGKNAVLVLFFSLCSSSQTVYIKIRNKFCYKKNIFTYRAKFKNIRTNIKKKAYNFYFIL